MKCCGSPIGEAGPRKSFVQVRSVQDVGGASRLLLLLCVLGHLFVQLCELLRLNGQFAERVYEIFAMTDGACKVRSLWQRL